MKKIFLILFIIPFVAGSQGFELPFGVNVKNPRPLDIKFFNQAGTPYTSTAQVLSELTPGLRHQGLTVWVGSDRYIFKNGIADTDLILDASGNGGDVSKPTDFAPTLLTSSITTFGRDGSHLVQVGEWVYVLGGWNLGQTPVTNSQVYRANRSNLSSWTQLSNAPWYRRHAVGCGVANGKIYIWGSDSYSANFAHDCWEGVVNQSTGAITWAQTNASLPYSNRVLYSGFVHNNELYTIGGQSSIVSPTYYSDIWKSSNGGTSWTQVQTGLTQFGKNISGCGASYNGKMYVLSGGVYQDDLFYEDPPDPFTNVEVRTYDKDCWVSSDNGLTWTNFGQVSRGVQFPSTAVFNDRLYLFQGGTGPGNNFNVFAYSVDKTNAIHQIYNTTIAQRDAASPLTVSMADGSQQLIYGLGTQTGVGAQNDLYTLNLNVDQTVVQGDNVRFNSILIDTDVVIAKIAPTTNLNVADFTSTTNSKFTIGTNTPGEKKFTYRGVNLQFGADEGAGGGNLFESSTLTANTPKMLRFSIPRFEDGSTGGSGIVASDGIGLLSSYSYGAGLNELYFGGSDGIGLAAPTKIVAKANSIFEIQAGLKLSNYTNNGVLRTSGSDGSVIVAGVLSNATDASFTATLNATHNILDGVATANHTITIPVGENGDTIIFFNTEDSFVWSFAGETVYLADRVTVVTQLLFNVPCFMQKIDGRWIITN
jgi:hypothetical protein